jgi:polyisoprenoid-binding protein YceI
MLKPTLMMIAAVTLSAATYEIDASHSNASFTVKHLMVSNVRGDFSKMSGTVAYDPKNVAATKIQATIDVNSINTRDAKRDDHLRSADFFDAAKFPTMTFQSKRVAPAGNGKLNVVGDLTLHGVTKEVTLVVEGPTPEVKDPWGGTRMGASATTKISRRDFGLTWNKNLDTGGVVIGDDVNITLEIEMVRKAAAQKTTD